MEKASKQQTLTPVVFEVQKYLEKILRPIIVILKLVSSSGETCMGFLRLFSLRSCIMLLTFRQTLTRKIFNQST